MICPFSQKECTPECGVYNPFIKGCALMVNPLALGEEIAELSRNVSQISEQLLILTNSLTFGLNHVFNCVERVRSTMEDLNSYVLEKGTEDDNRSDENVKEAEA